MWQNLAARILAGHELTHQEGLALLQAPAEENLRILDAAWTLRRTFFGNEVRTNILSNAKRGLCSEDCHYCGQSQHAGDTSLKFPLVSSQDLVSQARKAKEGGGRRFCITMAVRSAGWSAVDTVAQAAEVIKSEVGLEVCACLGLMTGEDGRRKLQRLKEAGVDAYNHNLNTHEDLYPGICTTHTYADRLETLRNARETGFSTCSGLIIGMGETQEHLVDLALTFRREKVASIPVNFLIPVEGTTLQGEITTAHLTPWTCLRYLCLFRLAHPQAELRASAGRELHIRSLQPLALLAANSLFLEGYLTQAGQGTAKDLGMIADLGMEAVELSYAGGD